MTVLITRNINSHVIMIYAFRELFKYSCLVAPKSSSYTDDRWDTRPPGEATRTEAVLWTGLSLKTRRPLS